MNPKLPIQAKCTNKLLRSVFPEHFKMVQDQTSNGYKLVNLLYGVEFDHLDKNIKETYNDSFITSIDLTEDYALYQLSISGVPLTNYLNSSDSIKIKITDETEFYKGSPTRIISNGNIPLPMYYLSYSGESIPSDAGFKNGFNIGFNVPGWSTISGIMGLEYVRKDLRGSGYLIISSDVDQEDSFQSGIYPTFVIEVGNNLKTSGDFINTYGIYTGIKDINYSGTTSNEVINPIDTNTLYKLYPKTRDIIDQTGVIWTIDHYTPDHGWTHDWDGTVVPIIDYGGDYYYDEIGKKIYYRTAFNNPYGYDNYTKAYLDLETTPISGTLKIFDIDNLDISGNAIEIPSYGKNLYYYKSNKMLNGSDSTDNLFDPIYLGYESTVPSGMGFSSNMEGSGCSLLKTTTWGYMHEGNYLDGDSLSWVDGTGNITNKIWISGYHSRYIVEYKTKIYDKAKCFSSINSDGTVSLDTQSPLITTEINNLKSVDYDFTKDRSYENQNSKVLTLDGVKYRPGSIIDKVSFNLPMIWTSNNLNGNFIYQNTNKFFAGYSNKFVPQVHNFRTYIMSCNFNSNTNTELDTSILSFNLTYSGNNPKFLVNYEDNFGKKIINNNSGSYFYNNGGIQIVSDTYYQFDCKIRTSQSGQLMELYDDINDKYILFGFENTGRLKIQYGAYVFYSRTNFEFNSNPKSFILNYVEDTIDRSVPTFNLYFKEKDFSWYTPINLTSSIETDIPFAGSTIKLFKDCSIDIGRFRIFYEAQ